MYCEVTKSVQLRCWLTEKKKETIKSYPVLIITGYGSFRTTSYKCLWVPSIEAFSKYLLDNCLNSTKL